MTQLYARRRPDQVLWISAAHHQSMVEEAIVDAYGESEQVTGFYTMLEDNLALPFDSVVLGVKVAGPSSKFRSG